MLPLMSSMTMSRTGRGASSKTAIGCFRPLSSRTKSSRVRLVTRRLSLSVTVT